MKSYDLNPTNLHSNMVNLKVVNLMNDSKYLSHLHSNMVNLKAQDGNTLKITLTEFTFQYG